MPIRSMEELLLEELRDIYSAERLALRAYPRVRKAIRTESLRQAVEKHLEQTKEQVERLGRVFEMMEAKTRGKTCHAMQGLIEEAQEHMEEGLPPELLEVVLVSDLQKIEHYEIACYGSARAHAEALGLDEAVQLLQQTLDEEKETDSLLNDLAVREINRQALGADEEEEEEDEGEDEEDDEGEGGDEAEPKDQGETGEAEKPARRSASPKSGGGRGKGGSGGGQSRNNQSRAAASEQNPAGGGDDLKSREYRDAQGNVHHHTRTSQGQGSRK